MELMSRRAFVGGGVAVAAGGLGLAGAERAVAYVGRLAGPAPGLARSRFMPLVGSLLELRDGGRRASVRLIGVRDLPRSQPANAEHQFSLLFESSGDLDWPQRTYELRAPGLGRVSLFAVPISRPAARRYYEVVVNSPIAGRAA